MSPGPVVNYIDDPVQATTQSVQGLTVSVLTVPPGGLETDPKTFPAVVNVNAQDTKIIRINGNPAQLQDLLSLDPKLQPGDAITAKKVDGKCIIFTCRPSASKTELAGLAGQ
jgi:hypothetical protein